MKLRFRANSLRLRVNQKEVDSLAAGRALKEQVEFPGGTALSYVLRSQASGEAQAFYDHGNILVGVPRTLVGEWATGDEIGLYFTLPTGAEPLKVAIEKDLVCIDGPIEEHDPNAFPRRLREKIC